MTEVSISGPAGNLEGLFTKFGNQGALLCHPHPQFGGSMHDMVLSTIEPVLHTADYSTLRFNFRGVGLSEGSFDNGVGETDDVKAAWDWLGQQCSAELLIGYSFGAMMALAVAQSLACQRLLLVAPPVSMLKADTLPKVDTWVVVGDNDQFAPVVDIESCFSEATVTILPTDHFFMGAHDGLAETVRSLIHGT